MKHPLRIIKGGFEPAYEYTKEEMRKLGFSVGDLVFAKITKPRNPRFNRLVHAFGKLLTENIESFKFLDSHESLKKIQIEANIACDEILIDLPGFGQVVHRVPKSLSYASMSEDKFRDVFSKFCAYVAERYWPECTPEQIESMAEVMQNE